MTEVNGSIRISDDVVAVIAGKAAAETPGIAAMSDRISEGLAKRLSGKQVQRGVTVQVGELEASIDLRVIIYYGEIIYDVCTLLQERVSESVEDITGLRVSAVNIKVEGVQLKEEIQHDHHPRLK